MAYSRMLAGLTVVIVIAAGTTLGAGHMQPGLWRISSTMDLGQAMPKFTPEQMAQMKAMGVQLPVAGQPMVSEFCVSPEQAAAETPPNLARGESGCTTQNIKNSGNMVSADIVCTGRIQGQGHMETSYSGMTHYEGKYRFQGTTDGRPQSTNMTFIGNFVSANCGSVKPLR